MMDQSSKSHIQSVTLSNNYKQIGEYIVSSELLGYGAFAKVYKGYLAKDYQTPIAVKVVPQTYFQNQFQNHEINFWIDLKLQSQKEIEQAKILQNTSGVIYSNMIKQTKQNLYIFMEYCPKGDLKKYLKDKTQLSENEAFIIFIDICKTFKICSENNIIHRDLKPSNVLIKQDQTFAISDFGFAKTMDNMNKKQTYTSMGIPLYESPQILMHEDYTAKTDVWSLGIIFYEMIYGCQPFIGKNIFQLYQNIEKQNINFREDVQISQLSKKLISGMLQVEENDRLSWKEIFDLVGLI